MKHVQFEGYDFKEGEFVIPDAEVRTHDVSKSDDFLVLACDGLWDVFTSQECVDWLRERVAGDRSPVVRSMVVQQLVEEAVVRGSLDNVSATVLFFDVKKAEAALVKIFEKAKNTLFLILLRSLLKGAKKIRRSFIVAFANFVGLAAPLLCARK